jgi:hypothetical protein
MPRALAAAAVSTLLVASGAAAAEFPVISIERTCSAAKPLDAQDSTPVETCLRVEREARAQLEAQSRRATAAYASSRPMSAAIRAMTTC